MSPGLSIKFCCVCSDVFWSSRPFDEGSLILYCSFLSQGEKWGFNDDIVTPDGVFKQPKGPLCWTCTQVAFGFPLLSMQVIRTTKESSPQHLELIDISSRSLYGASDVHL
jgi:hypothetical protein